jgi:DNA-binding MarR family transcriptional regulator
MPDEESPTWTPAGAAFTELLMRTFPLERRLSAAGEALAQQADLSLARWLVLEAIQQEPATVAEIGRRLRLARQGVLRLADLLVADGHASYEENPRHQRAKLLAITDAGRSALLIVQRAQRTWANRLGEQLGSARLRAAAEVLDATLSAVTADMPGPPETGQAAARV